MKRHVDMLWPVALFATLLLLTLHQIIELDIFYHLANGRSILDAGSIPRSNVFTFVDTPGFYPNPSWLFGVLAALLYLLGGIPALILAKVVVVLLLFGLFLAGLRRAGVNWPLACGWLWLVAMACAFRFSERPHLLSHLLLATFIVLEHRHRERGDRIIFLVVPLAALWANLHAGVVLGVGWLWLRLVIDVGGALAAGRWPAVAPLALAPERRKTLWITTLAASAAIFLTPTPLAIFRMIFGSTGIGTIYPITEYLAPSLTAYPWFYALVAVLALLLMRRPFAADPLLLLPPLVFLLLALTSNRFIPDFAIVAMPLVAARLKLIADRDWPLLRPSWRRLAEKTAAFIPGILVLTVVLLPPVDGRFGFGIDRREFPAGAVRFLQEQPLQGKLYNSLGHSGVAMFHLYPRYQLYQTSFFQVESARILEAGLTNPDPRGWGEFLDKYGIAIAFVDITREQHSVLHYPPEHWALVYFDDLSAIFLRRDAGNDNAIRLFEVEAAHPGLFLERDGMMGGIDRNFAAVAATELQRLLVWDDDNYIAHLMLANYLRVLEQLDAALQHYDRAIILYPRSAMALFQRGLLLRQRGELDAAVEDLQQATRWQPDKATYWNELGVTLGMQGAYKGAVAALARALEIDPEYAAARENLDHAQWLWKGR